MREMAERIERKPNAENIDITTTNTVIQRNDIGTDATGRLN
jgi:hypothetical protein